MGSLTDAGVLVVVVGAAISFLGWLGKALVEAVRSHQVERRRRHETLIRFYVDTLITVSDCEQQIEPASKASFVEAIERAENIGKPFKAYIASVEDEEVEKHLADFLYSLPDWAIVRIAKYLSMYKLMGLQYQKMATDEFADLSLDRKLSAIEDFYVTAVNVKSLGISVLDTIELLPLCGRFDAMRENHTRAVKA